MKSVVKHYRTTASPVDTVALRINGVGIQEHMPVGMVDRPKGTGDYLFMFFPERALVGAEDGVSLRSSGQLVVWEPFQTQHYGNPERRWLHSWIHVQGAFVHQCLKKAGIPVNQMIRCSSKEVDPYLGLIYKELTAQPRADATIAKNLLENWLLNLARKCFSNSTGPQVPTKFLELRQTIDEHFAARHTIKSLAQRVHLSPSHFCSLFLKYFGQSPIDYLIEQRLNHALYLLHDRNLSVSEIALATGYNDVYCFSKQFKKRLGQSPKMMREKL